MKPTDGRYQTEIRYRVKVLSLETAIIEGVDSVHFLEDSIRYTDKVRCKLFLRGLSPWYGIARKSQELGRACISSYSRIATNNPERRGSSEIMQAVGLIHSRGVVGVMPGEPFIWHSKGLAVFRKGEGRHYQASQRS
jgi:hypothetical protein